MDHRATLRAFAGLLIAAAAVASIYTAVTAGKMAVETGVHLDTSVSIVAFVLVFLIYRDEGLIGDMGNTSVQGHG